MDSKHIKILLLLLIVIGCKQEEIQNPPKVNTLVASNILLDKVTLNGEVIDKGTSEVKEHGFVISNSNPTPTVSDSKIIVGSGTGTYSIIVGNLLVNTKYYFRSYAINSQGTSYGSAMYFVTADYKAPTVTTNNPQNLATISVTLSGSLVNDGGSQITERGFYLSEYNTGNLVKSMVLINILGTDLGDFSKSISTLIANTKYSVKAYAKNAKGIAYGNEIIFNSLPEPALTTVISSTGRVWLNKNLGASRVAENISDANSFGYLYQWGRKSDGHQLRDSQLSVNLSASKTSAGNAFILSENSNRDWLITPDDNLWQGTNGGINNVCPTGFRIPTIEEWKAEIEGWKSTGAYNSPLKLPLAGSRGSIKGEVGPGGNSAFYWSSTPSPYGNTAYGLGFSINDPNGAIGFTARASGASVRCIKE
jgi:uncharacterized protein (TIGR02145 family)